MLSFFSLFFFKGTSVFFWLIGSSSVLSILFPRDRDEIVRGRRHRPTNASPRKACERIPWLRQSPPLPACSPISLHSIPLLRLLSSSSSVVASEFHGLHHLPIPFLVRLLGGSL
jgi:hypothetical protein